MPAAGDAHIYPKGCTPASGTGRTLNQSQPGGPHPEDATGRRPLAQTHADGAFSWGFTTTTGCRCQHGAVRDLSDVVYDVDQRQPCRAFIDGQWHEATLRGWRLIEEKWWAEVSYMTAVDVAHVKFVPIIDVRSPHSTAPS